MAGVVTLLLLKGSIVLSLLLLQSSSPALSALQLIELPFEKSAFAQHFLRNDTILEEVIQTWSSDSIPEGSPTEHIAQHPKLFNRGPEKSRDRGGRNLLAMVCLLSIFLLESCPLGLLIKNTVLLLSTLPNQ